MLFAIIETHPIQYHAPVYRYLAEELGIPLSIVYGSDFSVAGCQDEKFGSSFAWDTDTASKSLLQAGFVGRPRARGRWGCNSEAFLAWIERVMAAELTSDFWTVTLPNRLDTSRASTTGSGTNASTRRCSSA